MAPWQRTLAILAFAALWKPVHIQSISGGQLRAKARQPLFRGYGNPLDFGPRLQWCKTEGQTPMPERHDGLQEMVKGSLRARKLRG